MPNALVRNPVTLWQTYATATWVALQAYTSGQLVFPTVSNGFVYECTTGGTSAATQPTWPLTIGGTVTDGGTLVWTCLSTIDVQAAELATFEANLAAGINGVDGSTHAPAAAIIIAGENGLNITGLLTIAQEGEVECSEPGGINLQGGWPAWVATTAYSEGAIVVPTPLNTRRYLCTTAGTSGSGQPAFPTAYGDTVLDGPYPPTAVVWTCLGPDGDVPQYAGTHAGMTPTVVHSLVSGVPAVAGTWRVRNVDAGVQSVAPMMDTSDGNGPLPARWYVALRMHDAATVTQVVVAFRVGFPHTTLPSTMPGVRLLRVPTTGIPQPLTSMAAGADASGYVYLTKPSSALAWTGQQTLTLPCDQDNVIDVANYSYLLEIIEEQWPSGTLYPFALVMKLPVTVASTAFYNTEYDSDIDGIPTAGGLRVLFKDGLTQNLLPSTVPWMSNGIWIMGPLQGNTPLAAPDFTAPSDFTQGMIVPVLPGGAANGGTYWQAATDQTSWAGSSQLPPTSAATWAITTAYTFGQQVFPTASNGYVYECTTAGTTAGTEPVWPVVLGANVTDGSVVWTCSGVLPNEPLTFVARGPDDDETTVNAGTQFFAHGNVWQAAAVTYDGIVQQDME